MHRYTTRHEDDLHLPSTSHVAVGDLSTRIDRLDDQMNDVERRMALVERRLGQTASTWGVFAGILAGAIILLTGAVAGLWWAQA